MNQCIRKQKISSLDLNLRFCVCSRKKIWFCNFEGVEIFVIWFISPCRVNIIHVTDCLPKSAQSIWLIRWNQIKWNEKYLQVCIFISNEDSTGDHSVVFILTLLLSKSWQYFARDFHLKTVIAWNCFFKLKIAFNPHIYSCNNRSSKLEIIWAENIDSKRQKSAV